LAKLKSLNANTHEKAGGWWGVTGRTSVFLFASSSIFCLLADFYGICSMRFFTLWISIPCLAALGLIAAADRSRGRHLAWRGILIGLTAGLIAAVAYDIFRLPFVFAKTWGIQSFVPPMNLFKVFPRFGAMIMGQSVEQSHYSLATQWVGWLYHFSNGATFGVMFMAAVGKLKKTSWRWAVLMAVGLELGMLFTPYPKAFGIPLSLTFVCVTLAAHLIFGVVMGLVARALALRLHYPEAAAKC
jgi:hypothetical protein